MKIVADKNIPFLNGFFEPYAEIIYKEGIEIKKEDLIDADALLIRTRTKCNSDLLEGTSVKFIGTATIGFDHIDTDYCEAKNIYWTNSPGCNSSAVAQYVVSVLIQFAKMYNFDLTKKTLGIVGVGSVGKRVERSARLLGMNVILNDPPRAKEEGEKNFIDLDSLVENSDIVTYHCSLEKEGPYKTCHMIDKGFFEKIKKPIFLINSARGSLMDSIALKNALCAEKVTDCAIDCWENEPNIDRELLQMASITTPHIAGYSIDGKYNAIDHIAKKLIKFFKLDITKEIENPFTKEIINLNIPRNKKDKISNTFLSIYNPMEDTKLLKDYPEKFEYFRSNYKLRKDYCHYMVNNMSEKNYEILRAFGLIIPNYEPQIK